MRRAAPPAPNRPQDGSMSYSRFGFEREILGLEFGLRQGPLIAPSLTLRDELISDAPTPCPTLPASAFRPCLPVVRAQVTSLGAPARRFRADALPISARAVHERLGAFSRP